MSLGNYLFWPVYCFVYILPYIVLAFYIMDVEKYRKQALWVLIGCALIFGSLKFWPYAINPEAPGIQEYWISSVAHAMGSFAILGVFAYTTDEFFPRLFVKIDIYCDVVSTIAYAIYVPVEKVIFNTFDIQVTAPDLEGASKFVDIWLAIPYVWTVVCMVILYLVLGKKIDWLLKKIPDVICTIIFLGTFCGFIVSMATFGQSIPGFDRAYGQWNSVVALNKFFIVVGCIMILAIVMFTYSNRRYVNNMRLETSMQYEYYRNVAAVHNEVRGLRHDIANHINAMSYARNVDEDRYEQKLIAKCEDIRNNLVAQRKWTEINSQVLSKRELYELNQYVREVANKYAGDVDAETFTVTNDGEYERISVSIRTKKGKAFALKRNQTYELIKTMIKQHGGRINWQKNSVGLLLNIIIPMPTEIIDESEKTNE